MSDISDGGSAPVSSESSAPVDSSSEASVESTNEEGYESHEGGESPEDQVAEALEAGDVKEAQKLIEKFQLKVRGKTIEREVDLGDKEYLKQQLQLAEMSKLSMQEAAELKKAYQAELNRWKTNPFEVMQELGLDPDEIAEMRIQQRIEEMKKSPEQLEKERINRELEEARQEAKKLREEKEQIEMSKLQEQAMSQITSEIEKAISGHTTLPNSPYVQKRIADSMLWAMNNGFQDVTAEDVVPLVERELREELNKFMDVMPEEVMETYIGRKNLDRLRTKRISKAKAAPSINEVKPTTASVKQSQEDKQKAAAQKMAAKDFFRKLGK